ncbi:hypothetical protein [Streptomyces griseus]|uniref:hypothetical protein n=1 Tax=Streptomyces griseus TaxID=1911 RepID=UPI0004CAFFD7|nr:hypothetical protein [Streptomyces griseus]
MKQPIGKLAAVAGTAAAALALTAVPAPAAPSTVWTVGPAPGRFTAVNSGNVVLAVNGLALPCTRSTATGRVQDATGNPAPVAVVDTLVLGAPGAPCATPLGPMTITPVTPVPVLAQDHAAGVTKGYVDNADLKVTVGACTFRAVGRTSASYTNATRTFAVNSLAGELTVVSATGCGAAVPVGSKPTFKGNYLVTMVDTGVGPTIVGSNP